jgi:hypothetical protein
MVNLGVWIPTFFHKEHLGKTPLLIIEDKWFNTFFFMCTFNEKYHVLELV